LSGGPAAGPGEVVVATANRGKLREIREILGDVPIVLRGLDSVAGVRLPEEGDDYEANARAKAQTVARVAKCFAVADDSGLEVEGLGGAPGVHSARYGGPGLDDAGRLARLLEEMRDLEGEARRARFVCVAAFATPSGAVVTARGECPGSIRTSSAGASGFGYDPVFAVEEADCTMAQLPAEEKNRISHRGRAFRSLREALLRLL
jgi:XTP/dITP diphosphohydrolase